MGKRGKERQRDWCERETSTGCLSYTLTGDRIHSLGMCPDWESNPRTFGLQHNAPTNWATLDRAGIEISFKRKKSSIFQWQTTSCLEENEVITNWITYILSNIHGAVTKIYYDSKKISIHSKKLNVFDTFTGQMKEQYKLTTEEREKYIWFL